MLARPIKNIKPTDKVLGTDKNWYEIEPLSIEVKDLYRFITSAGSVICSFDHQWTLYIDDSPRNYSTIELYNDLYAYKNHHIGLSDGPVLKDIIFHGKGECRCIKTNAKDHQFAILTDKGNMLYSHNCGGRMICGYVDSTASQMALDNSMGTTIKGEHKGAGIYAVGKEMTNIQFYYADQDWIINWYKDRGLDEKGYPKELDAARSYDLGKDEEEIKLRKDSVSYEFEEEKKELSNQKEQKFESVGGDE